jgi:signal transduction histidine kinase
LARPDGSGLGLYISRTIIENHKGKLFFESAGENMGATFGFTLPIAT